MIPIRSSIVRTTLGMSCLRTMPKHPGAITHLQQFNTQSQYSMHHKPINMEKRSNDFNFINASSWLKSRRNLFTETSHSCGKCEKLAKNLTQRYVYSINI